jgi:hypothetical protein
MIVELWKKMRRNWSTNGDHSIERDSMTPSCGHLKEYPGITGKETNHFSWE